MKLRKPCVPHGRYEAHQVEEWDYRTDSVLTVDCPGGVFLPDDTLIFEKAPIEELHDRIKDVEVLAFDGRDYSGASAAQVISPDELGRILDALSVREADLEGDLHGRD